MRPWPRSPSSGPAPSTGWAALALCLLLAACTSALGPGVPAAGNVCASGASATNPLAQGGSGGTGLVAREGLGGTGAPALGPGGEGLGGTGATAQRPSGTDGIGGTASPLAGDASKGGGDGIGGTGIVGVVTGFASICVNGVELHYQPSTPVQQGERTYSAAQLAVGQVVAVRAGPSRADALQSGQQLQAQRIEVLYAAVGPITQISAVNNTLEVMGQRAQALAPEDLRGLGVGDWVRVSGHRLPTGEIRASRVQGIAAKSENAQVLGMVTAVQGAALRIGATTVQFGSAQQEALKRALQGQTGTAQTLLGRELRVSGMWDGARLVAQSATPSPTRAGLGAVGVVLLQGYVHGVQGNELQLGYESLQLAPGLQVQLDAAAAGAGSQAGGAGARAPGLQVGQRVQVRGRVGFDQRITAESVRVSSESGSRGANAATSDDNDSSSSGKGRGRGRGRGGDDNSGSGSSGSGQGRGRGGDSSGGGSSGSGSGSGSSGGGSSGGGSSGGSGSGGKGGDSK